MGPELLVGLRRDALAGVGGLTPPGASLVVLAALVGLALAGWGLVLVFRWWSPAF